MNAEQTSRLWVEGTRPKTIPAAVVPVIVGTAAAYGPPDSSEFILFRFLLALLVSVSLQVGVNYANDYSDGIRGTDEDRVGPRRLVASGLIPAKRVKWAAYTFFAIAALAGLFLAIVTSLWILIIGAVAIPAAWFYTGGIKPYGYRGLGEVSVFVFFGLVATVGSSFVQSERIDALVLYCAIPVGFLATALLVVNNLRDIATDMEAGKKTLAVRIGDTATRQLYALLVLGASAGHFLIGLIYCPPALLALAALPLSLKLSYKLLTDWNNTDLIKILESTAKLHLVSGALFSMGLWTYPW